MTAIELGHCIMHSAICFLHPHKEYKTSTRRVGSAEMKRYDPLERQISLAFNFISNNNNSLARVGGCSSISYFSRFGMRALAVVAVRLI